MKLWRKRQRIRSSIVRHALARNYQPYKRLLQHIRARGDIWIASQGEYISWWQKRENAILRVTVSDGMCRAQTSLENAVIEKFPGKFLDSPSVPCPNTTFSGEVWITIDSALKRKELLVELLKKEGILNLRIAREGDFVLSQEEVGPLLEEIEAKLRRESGHRLYESDIDAIRQLIIDKLAGQNLPLLRVWYHPRVNGVVPRAVFSPRYDVDRAITNLARIRALEEEYDVSSTLYVRAFCPFYTDKEMRELASMPWCTEIALHGEFVTNADKYGDQLMAAEAERAHLEELIGRPVVGVSMHGGELVQNRSENSAVAIQNAGFLYDTTRSFYHYFPCRMIVNGHLSEFYTLCHGLSDVGIPANRDYGRMFYERAVAKMDKIYKQNGIFVMMLHPVYFGFLSYLSRPRNCALLAKTLLRYVKSSIQRGQRLGRV